MAGSTAGAVGNFTQNISQTIDSLLHRDDGEASIEALHVALASCTMWSIDDLRLYRSKLPQILAHLFGIRNGYVCGRLGR
jgi:hypothetical protein